MDNDIRQLACKIAQEIFTNGNGERAHRLVMEMPNGRLGSGWIESSVARVIEEQLIQHQEQATPAAKRG